MEPSTLVAALCVALSFVLASCASDQVNQQEYSGKSAVQQPQPFIARKLKLQQEADGKSPAAKDFMLQKKLLEASVGKKRASAFKKNKGRKKVEKEEDDAIYHARKRGTWREWVESPNSSEYLTMDYSWVRRRRPIHNKQIPFVP